MPLAAEITNRSGVWSVSRRVVGAIKVGKTSASIMPRHPAGRCGAGAEDHGAARSHCSTMGGRPIPAGERSCRPATVFPVGSAAEFSKSWASMAASLSRRTYAISRSSSRKSGLVPTRCSRIDKRRSMASIRLRSRATARADGPDGPHGPRQHPRRADLSALVRRKAAEARRCGRCGRPGGTPQDSDTIGHARATRG